MSYNILVVDDESDIRDLIEEALSELGHTVFHATDMASTVSRINEIKQLDLIILDIWLDEDYMDGIGLLKIISKNHPALPVIVISGHADSSTIDQVIRLGAYDFLEKPFKYNYLLLSVKRALEAKRLKEISRFFTSIDKGQEKYLELVKQNFPSINLEKNILIYGSPGTEHELVAKSIRRIKQLAHLPLITIDTNHLEQIEAVKNHGIIFINISDLQPEVIQRILTIDNVRLILASFYSMSEQSLERIAIPNLCDLPELRKLIELCFEVSCNKYRVITHLSEESLDSLVSYHWEYNFAQLRVVLDYLAISAAKRKEHLVTPESIGSIIRSSLSDLCEQPYKTAKAIFEKEYLNRQLNRFDYNIAKTAEHMEIDRAALYRKVKLLGIPLKSE